MRQNNRAYIMMLNICFNSLGLRPGQVFDFTIDRDKNRDFLLLNIVVAVLKSTLLLRAIRTTKLCVRINVIDLTVRSSSCLYSFISLYTLLTATKGIHLQISNNQKINRSCHRIFLLTRMHRNAHYKKIISTYFDIHSSDKSFLVQLKGSI